MTAKIEDVARLAEVSTATVSRVLNDSDRVSEDARQRVLAAIRQLDYKVNLAARRLRTQETRTIAIVIPTIADPVVNRVVEAVEDMAIGENYALLMCSTRGNASRERVYTHMLTQRTLVDGVLYISPRAAPEEVLKLAQGGAPLVLCNYLIEGSQIPAVLFDHVSSMYQTTRYLLSLGHRRIALLNLDAPHYYPARMRRAGYEKAFAEVGLSPDPALIVEIHQPTYDTDEWQAAIHALLERPDCPTAIAAFNDEVALQVYTVCRQRGLRIPDDLSVTGCDDILSSRYVDPPLTTVRIPAYEEGRLAMSYLLRRIAQGQSELPLTTFLGVELIARGSCI